MSSSAPPPAARLRRVLGPEVVAGLLSVVVVAVTLPFLLQALNTPMGSILPAPAPSASVAGVAPSASSSPVARPSASGSALPAATATATGAEAWASEARVLVQAASGLIELRDDLARIVDARPSRAADIARQLRAMNPSLSATLEHLEGMESNGAPSDLVLDVRKPISRALAASQEALRASLPNREAYRAGAAEVLEALENVEALMARVEKEAGLDSAASR